MLTYTKNTAAPLEGSAQGAPLWLRDLIGSVRDDVRATALNLNAIAEQPAVIQPAQVVLACEGLHLIAGALDQAVDAMEPAAGARARLTSDRTLIYMTEANVEAARDADRREQAVADVRAVCAALEHMAGSPEALGQDFEPDFLDMLADKLRGAVEALDD